MEKQDNRVAVFIPRGLSNEDPNLFVSVNGVNYLLPKGKESLVPAFVAQEIERANKAKQAADMHSDQLLSK